MEQFEEQKLKKLLHQVDLIIENYKWLLDTAREESNRYLIQISALEKRLKSLDISNARKQHKIKKLEKEINTLSKVLSEKEGIYHVNSNTQDC